MSARSISISSIAPECVAASFGSRDWLSRTSTRRTVADCHTRVQSTQRLSSTRTAIGRCDARARAPRRWLGHKRIDSTPEPLRSPGLSQRLAGTEVASGSQERDIGKSRVFSEGGQMIASTFRYAVHLSRSFSPGISRRAFRGLGINPYGFQPYAEPQLVSAPAQFDHRKPGISCGSCRRTAAGGASAGADRAAAASVLAAVGVGPVAGTSTTPASRPAVCWTGINQQPSQFQQQQPFGQSTQLGRRSGESGPPPSRHNRATTDVADDGNVDRHDLRQD